MTGQSWNNKNNAYKLKSSVYASGQGTGFLPGEYFPGIGDKLLWKMI